MVCPNCNHDNPEGAQKCEECGANFEKSIKASQIRDRSGLVSNISACLTSIVSYFLIALLIALTIAAVFVFNCVYNVPPAPEQGYHEKILELWQKINEIQEEKCIDIGYAGEKEGKGIGENFESAEVESEGQSPEACGEPNIRFEPENGTLETRFDIFLEGFSTDDLVDACWYYPSGEMINCVKLDVDENGFRKTAYWSEENDPIGEYSMQAAGQCSRAEIFFLIESP